MADRDLVRQERYTSGAIVLHWASAAGSLFNLGVGLFLDSMPRGLRGLIIPLHISAGMTILALTAVRVLWRLTHQPPHYPAAMQTWERQLSHVVHFGLYVAMVAMPVIGWGIVSAHPPAGSAGEAARNAGKPPAPARVQKLWYVLPLPLITPVEEIGATAGGVAPQDELHEKFVTYHWFGGWILLTLFVLHVAGALKHQLFDRQDELARMGVGRRLPEHDAAPQTPT